jgi:hypothetical protein
LPGQRGTAEQFRVVAELAGDDLDGVGHHGGRVPVDGLPDSGQHVLAGRAERPVDDHRGRVEHRAEAGQRPAHEPAEVGEYPADARIALRRERENLGERELFLSGQPDVVKQRGPHDRGQAAATAAGAQIAVVAHLHVREFAAEPGGASVQPPPDDEARSHVVAERDVDEAVMAAAGAEGGLTQRAEVGVVLHPHRDGQPLRHRGGRLARGDRPWQPDHGAAELIPRAARPDEHLLDQVTDRPREEGQVGRLISDCVGRRQPRDDLPGVGDEGGLDAGPSAREHGRDSRRRGRRQRPRRTAGLGSPVRLTGRALYDKLPADQVADHAGDGRPGQSGQPDQIGPGKRSRAFEQREQFAGAAPGLVWHRSSVSSSHYDESGLI